jgi:hypothetical protein
MPARRRTPGLRRLQLGAAAAAAIAIAAGLGSLAGSLTSRSPAPVARHISLQSLRVALAAGTPAARPGSRLPQRTAV